MPSRSYAKQRAFNRDSIVPRIVLRLAVPQKTDCSDPKIPISEVLLENPHYGLGERGSIEVRSVRAKYDRKGHRRIRATETRASFE